jgi:uncharacterized membrane protein YvlD (DUF360 family)
VQDMQAFRIGSVLSRSFSLLFQNFLPYTFLIAIVYVPLLALDAAFPVREDDIEVNARALLSILLYMAASGFVAYGVLEQLRGQRASMKACMAACLRQIVPVLGSSLLSLVCILLGLFVLVVPGIIVMLMFWVTVHVAVIERLGILATLERSRELTRGHKVRLFGIFLVIWLPMIGLGMLANAITEDLGSAAGFLVTLVNELLNGVVGAVITAVIYHDLRTLKDGVGVDDVVRVFE